MEKKVLTCFFPSSEAKFPNICTSFLIVSLAVDRMPPALHDEWERGYGCGHSHRGANSLRQSRCFYCGTLRGVENWVLSLNRVEKSVSLFQRDELVGVKALVGWSQDRIIRSFLVEQTNIEINIFLILVQLLDIFPILEGKCLNELYIS